MIDTDDLDRRLRDELASAAELSASPSDPAPRVAARVRRRRRQRTALRVSLAASVPVVAALAFAFTRPTETTAPAHPPAPPIPSVLSTPQVESDRFARTLPGAERFEVNWTSVRLLEQRGQARLFGARDVNGALCVIVAVPASKGEFSAGTGCGGVPPTTAQAAIFAAHGSEIFQFSVDTYALGYFVPDSVRTATVDGATAPVTRNGLLVTFRGGTIPKRITLSSTTGTVTITFTRDADGLLSPTVSGAFE